MIKSVSENYKSLIDVIWGEFKKDRVTKAIAMSNEFNKSDTDKDIRLKAFEILDCVALNVGFNDLFRWIGKRIPPSRIFLQIVFDLTNMKVIFKSLVKKNSTYRELSIKDINFLETESVLVYDVEQLGEGSILNQMETYTKKANEKIVRKTYMPVIKDFPIEVQEEIICFPELYLSEKNKQNQNTM